ncbi:proline racemase family protein [Mesobacillus foraminis]|uniref:proline racemase family protein n=1 Tax=Mesobacillus foraminis TaxID=279826 RepID=UPI0039A2AB11
MNIQRVYSTIDVHVAGETFRIMRDTPFIHYQNLEQLNEKFPDVFAAEINLLLNEPRGFAGLTGCLAVPPISREADLAVLFFNHEGMVPIQFGGIVAVLTAMLECGHLEERASRQYKIETVNGLILVTATMENGEVVSVMLESKSCQVVQTGISLPDSQIETKFSLVYTDQLYAVFEKQRMPAEIDVKDLAELKSWGKEVFQALDSTIPIQGVILMEDCPLEEGRIKSITFLKDQYILRSPGFGPTAACYLHLCSKRETARNQSFVNESIFGSCLQMQLTKQIENEYQFTYTSRGFITGMQTFVLDPTDPLPAGFLLK